MIDPLSTPVATAFAQTLIHFLWQGILIAAGYWIIQRALGARSAHHRYLVALTALGVMAGCPLLTFCFVYSTPAANHVDRESITATSGAISDNSTPLRHNADSTHPTFSHSASIGEKPHPDEDRSAELSLMLMFWLAGVGLSGTRLLASYFSVAWLRWGRTEVDSQLAVRSRYLAERVGLHTARVFTTDRIREAAVVGFWRPVVLLPTSWVAGLPADILEAVIAHELAHIRRHDVWINLVQRIVETLLFYHPAMWWLSNCVRLEREMCCDELAIQATGERKLYAIALERIGRLQLDGSYRLAPSFRGERKMNLLRRVKHVLQIGQPDREPTWLIGVLAVVVPVAFLCALGGIGVTEFQAVAQDREGGRSAEADAGPRRSPEAEAGPRRSAERDRNARGDEEDESRGEADRQLRDFRPQTPREAALLQMIQQLQREMAQLRREVRRPEPGERLDPGERPVRRDSDRDAFWDTETHRLPAGWERSKAGRVFQAYDKNSDGMVVLEEWLSMTNGNINDARRALQTRRFRDAEPSGDGKFMPAEFIWWYKIGRYADVEGGQRDRDGDRPRRGSRDDDAREGDRRDGDRRDREDEKATDRVQRDSDVEKRGPRDGDREKAGPRNGEREKAGPRDRDRD
ncbi:M56 family metallopeptidase [Thalassoroseus pseudoceratinae]|uniref:M56 family metallopeptidase n=1 Tax=Thalassoroseus pseudoceratinae TaxID=2713176 RepID=UPI001422D0F0|nr:M56 family metallopeptidase [Thalassoroseus pseudoceratinae]